MIGINSMSGISGMMGSYNNMNTLNLFQYSPFNVSGASGPSWFRGAVTGLPESTSQSSSSFVDEEARAYMAGIREFGNRMRSATSAISGANGQSLFNRTMGVSSNNNALNVTITNQADAASSFSRNNNFNVTIESLATSQQNRGFELNASSLGGVSAGTNRFTIEQGGRSYDFSVNVNNFDSARSIQERTANAINSQNIGVRATVDYNAETNRSTLVLSSVDTGADNNFEIRDNNSQGNLVSTLGIGEVTREASDAEYTVNGESRTSESNTVELAEGVTAVLRETSEDTIRVSSQRDTESITDAIKDLVNSYNDLRRTAIERGSDRRAEGLRQRLDDISSSYELSVSRIGITRNRDGYLEVDENRLRAAFEGGSAERYLGNDDFGFTQRLSRLASQVDSNPGQFVSQTSRPEVNAFTDNGANNDYEMDFLRLMTSNRRYQELAGIGLLLSLGV